MPAGGTISLKTGTYEVVSQGKTQTMWICCEVQDDGIGMDQETLRRCFEPFYTTKGEMGTGLGLATVYGVMQRHEGRVEVESELGAGATLRLLFPVPKDSPTTSTSPEVTIEIPPLHILIIDDEPLLRLALCEALSSSGHRIQVADGGQVGLEKFTDAVTMNDPFDVVITDLGMPYVDGRKVTRQVKNISPGVPVILLTGWGSRMQAEGNLPFEIDYILGKPPSLDQLQQALLAVLPKIKK
jgi:CheY-like chemotaxis protein